MSKLIMPKHVWDGKKKEKQKNELEKVPKPCGWKIVLFPLKLERKTSGGVSKCVQEQEHEEMA